MAELEEGDISAQLSDLAELRRLCTRALGGTRGALVGRRW